MKEKPALILETERKGSAYVPRRASDWTEQHEEAERLYAALPERRRGERRRWAATGRLGFPWLKRAAEVGVLAAFVGVGVCLIELFAWLYAHL